MRRLILSAPIWLCLPAAALAKQGYAPAYPPPPTPPSMPQPVPPGAGPETGARPGNVIGTGMSEPMSNRAANINQGDQPYPRIAPNLPTPPIGENASAADYLRSAQASLAAGRTGEAQQSLEMAETRLLDSLVPYGTTGARVRSPAIAQISQARQALAAGDRARSMQLIDAALAAAQAPG